MHWCYQETEALMMLLSAIPLIGLFFKKWHASFHNKWKTLCLKNKCCHHKVECQEHHLEHTEQVSKPETLDFSYSKIRDKDD